MDISLVKQRHTRESLLKGGSSTDIHTSCVSKQAANHVTHGHGYPRSSDLAPSQWDGVDGWMGRRRGGGCKNGVSGKQVDRRGKRRWWYVPSEYLSLGLLLSNGDFLLTGQT